jgi:Lon-like ATP-dependent protease
MQLRQHQHRLGHSARAYSSVAGDGGDDDDAGGDDDAGDDVVIDFDQDYDGDEVSPGDRLIEVLGGQGGSILPPQSIPEYVPNLLVLPVDRTPVFPAAFRVMTISNPGLKRKIEALYKSGLPWVGAFMRKGAPGADEDTIDDLSEVYPTGVFCKVTHIQELDGSNEGEAPTLKVLMQGIRRVYATGPMEEETPFVIAEVDNLKDRKYEEEDQRVKAYHNEIVKTMRDIMHLNPMFRENVQSTVSQSSVDMNDPSAVADFAASLTSGNGEDLQKVLEELNVDDRQPRALELLKHEYLQAKLQHDISKQVEDKVSSKNREHMLREQLKIIKKELGITKDDKDAVGEKFRERLEGLTVPAEVAEVIDDEMNKLGFLDQNSSEFNVTRNYLDWLTALPWGKTTEESLDIDKAQTILDEDHYGMKDVKDRVLEFIAVGNLRGSVQGKILCFVGPPGVGKTSIAKSIARAINREYYRFSVGGLSDVAEIKGHRRTYVGAMPGKLIQCLKKAEAENPLVCIDEIDKVGRGHNGDPTSALLELLDPEQNGAFLDHYLDVPVDLSKVLFLCTANTTDTIPGPLLDRMEVIELSGYMSSEKVAIAQNYIIPTEEENAGIPANTVDLTEAAVAKLITEYCRESGVRSLQKKIQKLYRKSALMIVRDREEQIEITPDNLNNFVGNPIFTSERMYDETPAGVIMGLAWTSMGGTSLYIETVTVPTATSKDGEGGGGRLSVTGQLGDVMKESSQISYTFAKSLLHKLEPGNDFFLKNVVNLHVPEGATPKDGPSAGVTIVSALMSLALDRPARQNLAMTGEISLTGKVLRVGGIKEKILAAKRAGVTKILLPEGCKVDFLDLDDEIKEDLEVHFASTYDDVYQHLFE